MKKITLLFLTFLCFSFWETNAQLSEESFESGIPATWTVNQVNTVETWKISTTEPHSGSNKMIVEYDPTPGNQDENLVTPVIDLTSSTNPRLVFWWNMSYHWGVAPNDNYDFTVSIDNGTTVTQLFTETDEANFDSTDDNWVWFKTEINLAAYVGQSNITIIFNYTGNDGASLSLDDVKVDETPTCQLPTSLTATNITNSTASIGWTASPTGETAWEYVVQAAGGSAPAASGTATTSNPTNLTGLTSNTDYEFYVRADCTGGDYSSWVGPFAFTTDCDTFTAPYTEDFEDSGSAPPCWTLSGAENWGFANTGTGNHIGDNGTVSGNTSSGGYFAWVDSSGAETDAVLESPSVNVNGLTTPALSFYILSDNEGNANSQLQVDVWDGSAWNSVGTYNSNTNGWEEKTINISGLTFSGPAKARFTFTEPTSSDFYDDIAIDDVKFDEFPSCSKPTALSASNITDTTVDIGWTAGGSETAWEYVVQAAGGSAPAAAGTATTSNPTNITGLTANTSYEFYVRANCGGDFSDWSGPFTFSTACTTFTAPYTEDFENAGSAPDCWNLSGAENWDFSDSAGSNHIGNNGAITGNTASGGYFAWVDSSGTEADAVLESPSVNVSGLTTPALSFYELSHNEGNANSQLLVEVWDGAAWNTVGTYNTNTSGWEEKIIDLSGLTFSGPAKVRFTFTEPTSSDFYDDIAIDDVKFYELPSCIKPSSLMASNVTHESVDLGWAAGGTESEWEYVVQAAGGSAPAAAGTATSDNPTNVTGLTENTSYEFYVRAKCGVDFSEWSGPVTFTTLLAPITPDYTNDFSTFPGDGWSEANGAFMMPSGTSGSFAQDDFGNDTGHANGKAAKINIYGTSIDEYLVSPKFDLSGGTYYLNFDLALTKWNNMDAATLGADDYLALLVTSDNGTSWTELARWDSTSTLTPTGDAVTEIALTGYNNQTYFAFYAFSDTSNEDNDLFIDNFKITTTALGISKNTLENFNLFPTVVKDEISFTSQKIIDNFEVYNLIGQKVFSKKVNLNSANFNLSTLKRGVYIVKVKSGDSIGSYKIIKE